MNQIQSLPAARILFSQEDRREIAQRIDKILQTGKLTLGPFGEELESDFARLCTTKYAIAVASGTCSLEIILRSYGITQGTVLVPTNTFFATPAAVRHAGAKVRFVDQNTKTLAPSLEHFKEAYDQNTKAVIVVHIGGTLSNELPEIRKWCDKENLLFIEDAAHAHGSTLNGKPAGSFGHASSFSFYPTKVMTSGEGGMIVTNDENLAIDARRYRDQGKESFTINRHTRLGNNWRMSEIHAAVGLQQVKRLPEFLQGRRRAGKQIQKELYGLKKLPCFIDPEGVNPNFYKLMALLSPEIDRAIFKKSLKEKKNISFAGEVYELPCHEQPIFSQDPYCEGKQFVQAENFCRRHVCLPIYPNMTEEEIQYLTQGIKEVLND